MVEASAAQTTSDILQGVEALRDAMSRGKSDRAARFRCVRERMKYLAGSGNRPEAPTRLNKPQLRKKQRESLSFTGS